MSGPGKLLIGKEERSLLLNIIDSGHLYRYGDLTDKNFKKAVFTLEKSFSKFNNNKYSVATVSGTMALVASLKALEIGEGDEVLVPGYTYIASYSAIIFAGATPIPVEIDETLTINLDDIKTKLTKKTKAIMPVHMLGSSANIVEICKFAKKNNLFVIEDCAQAFGAQYNKKKIGSYGDISAFSLNHYKVITTGDGGIISTNNKNLYEKAFAIHDQGHKLNRASSAEGKRKIIGLNIRMNELTGAVALAQLKKVNFIIKTLRNNKIILKKLIHKNNKLFEFKKQHDEKGECATSETMIFTTKYYAKKFSKMLGTRTISTSGWHVYSNMENIRDHLKKKNINFKKGTLPKTDDILERSVSISLGVSDDGLGTKFGIKITSTLSDIKKVAKLINNTLSEL